MSVKALKDSALIQAFLTQDRVGNAYLLGDLDEAYMPFCDWYGEIDGDDLRGLVLVYKGLSLPAVLTVGPADKERCHTVLNALFRDIKGQLPRRFWVHAWEHHRSALEQHFNTGDLKRMIRMSLHRDTFRATDPTARVRRLDHPDTAAIMALYQHYPDNFFEPYQLESGLYFGVDAGDGELAAIAGIHVFSRTFDIAAIGNLVTHPDHRRQGYASAVTTRLLEELFKSVSLVTLNVQEGNVAAIGTYEKFGFTHHHVYYEGRVDSQEP